MLHEVTISSVNHTINTPVAEIKSGDLVKLIDADGLYDQEETLIAFDNSSGKNEQHPQTQSPDCSKCPLFGRKICQYHWCDENNDLHSLCESVSSLTDANATDIRFDSVDKMLENL